MHETGGAGRGEYRQNPQAAVIRSAVPGVVEAGMYPSPASQRPPARFRRSGQRRIAELYGPHPRRPGAPGTMVVKFADGGETAAGREVVWAELIRRIAFGDRSALAPLYDATCAIVYGVALAVTGDSGTAEDISSETYLQIWRRAHSFDADRGKASTWMRTLARSRAIDRLRSDGRERLARQSVVEDASIRTRATVSDPAVDAERAERGLRARQALAALPEAQREVMVLAYFEGLSQSEIAERIGEPLGTVKSRVRLAMARLQELLVQENAS